MIHLRSAVAAARVHTAAAVFVVSLISEAIVEVARETAAVVRRRRNTHSPTTTRS